MPWLLKTEPDVYAWADLVRDGATVWDGVTNALALKHIRTAKKGELALIYHTGKERSAVGIARLTTNAYLPNGEEKLAVFDIEPIEPLASPVTLATIKADETLADWSLIRLARLSVVPTTKAQLDRVIKLAHDGAK
jgi:predicted RNA-binding protein with PUA-like domain